MAVDLIVWRDSLVNLLDKNNVTTSSFDISGSLKRRVKYIKAGEPNYGQSDTQLPTIFVRVGEYSEERNTQGESAHRDAEITFEIYPVTQYAAGLGTGRQLADDEVVKLTQSIQDLVRNKNDLSITSMMVQGIETTFNEEVEESTYVKATKISILCTNLVT